MMKRTYKSRNEEASKVVHRKGEVEKSKWGETTSVHYA
jgi:hypothetical protein